MNLVKLILATAILLLNAHVSKGETDFDLDSDNSDKVEILKEQNNTKRPRMPSKFHVTCYYTFDKIRFELPEHCQSAYIEIKVDDEIIINESISSEYPVIHTFLDMGKYNISCQLDDGRVFNGRITLN